MAVVKALSLKDTNDQDVLYDIGADAINIDYDNSANVKTKIDNILEEIASLQEEYGEHFDALINSSEGIHGIRYYNNELQYYDGTEWQTISTNQTDTFLTQLTNGRSYGNAQHLGYITNRKNVSSSEKISQINFTNGAVEDIDTNNGKIINVKSGGLVVAANWGNLEDHTDLRNTYWDDSRYAGLFFKNIDYRNYETRNGEGGKSIIIDFKPQLAPWGTGDKYTIRQMIRDYYNGDLSISDIKGIWAVGDIRPFYDATHSNWVDFVILDFEHDELNYAKGSRTKALITIQTKNILMETGKDPETATSAYDGGYKTNYIDRIYDGNLGMWHESKIRDQLQYHSSSDTDTLLSAFRWDEEETSFYNFYESLQTVFKYTATGTANGTISLSADIGFLPSLVEVIGSTNYNSDTDETSSTIYSYEGEGYQYEYFKIDINRYKKPIDNTSGYINYATWSLRSPQARIGQDESNRYIRIKGRLTPSGLYYMNRLDTEQYNLYVPGWAPAFCM